MKRNNIKCALKLTFKSINDTLKFIYCVGCEFIPLFIISIILGLPIFIAIITIIYLQINEDISFTYIIISLLIAIPWIIFCFNYAKCSDFWQQYLYGV